MAIEKIGSRIDRSACGTNFRTLDGCARTTEGDASAAALVKEDARKSRLRMSQLRILMELTESISV
jgi:hypothetical protein